MPRLSEIDELLSPAQKRRKEAVARQAEIDASFRPAPYAPYHTTEQAKAEEAQFGTTNTSLIEARRAEGGIYSDPETLKKRMTEDPETLGAELEAQLAQLEGRVEGPPVPGRVPNVGGRVHDERARRQRVLDLQTELSVTEPSTGAQYRSVVKHEPKYLAMAQDIGAPETLEQLKADAANRRIDARTAASIEARLTRRAALGESAMAGDIFAEEMVLPGSRADAEAMKAAREKAEGDAKIVQAEQEQAAKAAAKPDQLTDLLAQAQTPNGPEKAVDDPMKSVFGEGGPEGLPIPGLGKVFSYNPAEHKSVRETLPDMSLDPLRELMQGLSYAAGGRESAKERKRRLAREAKRRG